MEGVRHAMLQMVVQDLLLDLVERRPDRAELGQHVDAVAVFLDHAGDAAHLAFDAAEAGELGFLVRSSMLEPYPRRVIDKHVARPLQHDHAHAETAIDPVCGMTVRSRGQAPARARRPDLLFLQPRCRAKFMADPERYLGRRGRAAAARAAGTIYTCPMHPEIRQIGPGTCPICGMALEP